MKYLNFYIDESPNGARYFVDADVVSMKEFEKRRKTECFHIWRPINNRRKYDPVPARDGECKDCGLRVVGGIGR
jgi:hypothetical protein